ncbi:MAG TPA: acyl-CoA dehydrogenase [Myxococcota bacterium]|nr:acyl-CoA dehydrogenase [Myxococcota bacterium]
MQLGLTEEQDLLQRTFAELFSAESSPERVRAAEATGFDPGLWKHLIETGAIGIRVPEAQDGSGAGLHDAVILAEQAGRALASVPLVEAICVAGLLARIGTDAARAPLADILAGGCIPTLALHEVDRQPTQLVPGGAAADVVLALDGDAVVLVRRRRVAAEPPPANIGSSALAHWQLDVAPAGGERVVLARGAAARSAYQAAREEWRLLTAAALAGLAQRALEIGADYAKSRIQFDRPIGAFQGVAHPLADAATAVSASQLMVSYAIWSIATGQREAAARICFAFAAAAESAGTATARALHVHGGYGLSLEYDIQLYYRRAKSWALAGGDPRDELLRAAARLWDDGAEAVALPDAGACALDWSLGEGAERVRAEVRAFCQRALTPELRAKAHFSWDGHDPEFHKEIAKAGLLFPSWPRAYGGRETNAYENSALLDEFQHQGWSTHAIITTGMVGQTLIKFATDELKREVLPRVLAGDAVISLGYTEPASGSDVAAAQCRAVRDGDHWVIDGQKMFTSGADRAQYVFLLTRTDPSSAKHKGLTMFLVPLDAPGITVHPVLTLSDERTNVTYYSGARIPDRYRVGEVGGGWNVVGYALEIEHGAAGGSAGHGTHLRELAERASRWARTAVRNGRPVLADARACERLARVQMHADMSLVLDRRVLWLGVVGRPDRGEGPMSKLFPTDTCQIDAADLLDLWAPESLLKKDADGAIAEGDPEFAYRVAAATRIYAGTSEIMRSIIAQLALGLPRSRS